VGAQHVALISLCARTDGLLRPLKCCGARLLRQPSTRLLGWGWPLPRCRYQILSFGPCADAVTCELCHAGLLATAILIVSGPAGHGSAVWLAPFGSGKKARYSGYLSSESGLLCVM
jgi:hypothetical protein